ncbi:aldo/keto reductase [Agaricicola taiwanensis]|nr:aldo/keto reductase [Agaricicola taiwanensis]
MLFSIMMLSAPESEPRRAALALGTVQLGLPYGVANSDGMPDEAGAFQVLDAAYAAGITAFDTARVYGEAEARIGSWLRSRPGASPVIITKLPAVQAGSDDERRGSIRDNLNLSRRMLGVGRLQMVMAHRGTDLLDPLVSDELQAAVDRGEITAIGGSFYTAEEALQVMAVRDLAGLQLPLSAVDTRAVNSGVLTAASERGTEVFARSVFLQGALLMPPDRLPPHLAPLAAVIRELDGLALRWQIPIAHLLLLFLRELQGVSYIVVGVERGDQLASHLEAMTRPPLSAEQRQRLNELGEDLPRSVLDPSQWPR